MRSLLYAAALMPLQTLAWSGKGSDVDEIVVVTTTRTITVCPITEAWTCAPDVPTAPWQDWTGTPTNTVSVSPTSKGDGNGGPGHTTSPSSSDDSGHPTSGQHSSSPSSSPTTSGPYVHPTSSNPTESPSTSPSGSPSSSGPYVGPSSSSTPVGPTSSGPYGSSTVGPVGPGTSSSPSGSYGSSTSSDNPVGPGTSSSSDNPVGPGTSSSSVSPAGPSSTSSSSAVAPTSSSTGTSTSTATSTTSCAPSQTVSALSEDSFCADNTPDNRSKWCGQSVTDDTAVPYRSGHSKSFTLRITDADIDFDGTVRPAFAINGGTPGPAIEANWGDLVSITVINELSHNATTIHWHGIRQLGTNDQDGVPGVTECAIPPNGGTRTYTWLASSYGTGWYHSHALSQYGGGIRGPVIIHGPSTADYDHDMGPVMIDEIFSQTIFQMAWNIARARGPLPAAVNYMVNGKNKSPDGSTGKATQWTVEAGKKHLFRIINSSAQSSFIVHFDNHEMLVISSDFTPIVPYKTNFLYINPGQRYNVIVEMNQTPGAYFMRAITQTGCGVQNLNNGLGIANPVFTYKGTCGTPVSETITLTPQTDCRDEPLASLVPVVSKNAGSLEDFTDTAKLLPGGNGGSQVFDGYGPIIRWYFGGLQDLSGNSATTLGNQTVSVDFENPTLRTMAELPTLGFNSSRYSNAVVLDGPEGDWVYFVIQNNFQTSHPIHLHGHDFSVLGQGKGVFSASQASSLNFANPSRRDTTLLYGFAGPGGVAQPGWTVIGFETDNPGAWLMHCHITWHADGGMGLQYIEHPDKIDAEAYWTSSSFQDECSAYESYIAGGGEPKLSYEAGLKRDLERHRYALAHKNMH
ncbi:hypothetical protein Z517_06426 [Fonsecaea pedrosoi CBS 271.37]|uniref:Laccase n=1 Tax=Fonsecaea pedrosoi CBS 271.37 TaxID=1442368 RepID=A0A0D2DPW4_9EURO|nr:uncharacterized protein Z517_06426 [Fonsecaea pedrosoi CBS 271.37]KIW79811.1 hypothetical protein Z517_06426 [Fonsecaea pedrosoi CBS 271.37]